MRFLDQRICVVTWVGTNAKHGIDPSCRGQDEVFQAHRCQRRRVVVCGWETGGDCGLLAGVRWRAIHT